VEYNITCQVPVASPLIYTMTTGINFPPPPLHQCLCVDPPASLSALHGEEGCGSQIICIQKIRILPYCKNSNELDFPPQCF